MPFSFLVRDRGQVSMPDVMFATIFFFLILAGLVSFSDNLQQSTQHSLDRRNLDIMAANVAEYIIKNPGTPTNWEQLSDQNQIVQIGLAQKDRVLRAEKVVAFVNMGNTDYANTRVRLNIPYYEFYAQFSGGTTLTTGQAPPSNADASVVTRFVTINGVETTFALTLYEP